jgi:hypothetical protein
LQDDFMMTRRSNPQSTYVPRFPLWLWIGLASRNGGRGLLLGAFVGLLFRSLMNAAVLFLRRLVRLLGFVFCVSEQTALAMVVSFLVGVLVGLVLLSGWTTRRRASSVLSVGPSIHQVNAYTRH